MRKQIVVLFLSSVVLFSVRASAQVEAMCPNGWDRVPAPAGGNGQHVVAACVRGDSQIVATQIDRPIPPNDPEESGLASQISQRIGGEGNPGAATPFRNETLGGLTIRVSDLSGTMPSPAGAPMRVQGVIIVVPAGSVSVAIVGMSRDPRADVRPVVRAFIPTMVGITGGPPAWRANAECPSGMRDVTGDGATSNGMRLVRRCANEGGMQFEVLESRLPVRNAEDAAAPARILQRSLDGRLRQMGGSATVDPAHAVTFGTQSGFVTAVHASAGDPSAQSTGSGPPQGVRIEAGLAMIPTTIGHVEVMAVSQALDAAAVATQLQNFVAQHLRLDGAVIAATGPTESSDGGIQPASPPPPRHREIDPDLPLWEPPVEDAHPTASHPAEEHKNCGCAVPGAPSRLPYGALASVVGIAVMIRRRRKHSRA